MLTIPLSGNHWKFRDASTKAWRPAIVPGCVHTDLHASGAIPDPFHGTNELALQWIESRDWEYKTEFIVSAALLTEEVIELVADGLDTIAAVTLNGRVVARTENMFVGYRWPVKRWLRLGRNELTIRFRSARDFIRTTPTAFTPPREFNDPVGNCVRIRKQQCQFGWDWGPRFVTAGIWRDIRLEAWSGNRLSGFRVTQRHARNGAVALQLAPEFPRSGESVVCSAVLALAGREIARIEFTTGRDESCSLPVPSPQLWWPAGQGKQPLYELTITARSRGGRNFGTIRKRIGLRTIHLDRSADRWGEAFRFLVNGRPVFFKGANWIPAHSFVAGLTRRDYERDLRAAATAHMNAIRVWGGGIYESEHFYDLCDELGLLVWQDFMFACTLYPADRRFVVSVEAEVAYQSARLHHRACLALWCGNNELAMLNPALEQSRYRKGYKKLFHQVIPATLAKHDSATPYWPSSPWRGSIAARSHEVGEKSGDTHFWDVWHARHPVKDYEKWNFRFVSEFGMQSYSSPATNATFSPPGERNVFGATMENHQKNRAGNQVILDYVSRRYRFPNSQDGLIYLSQLNQAYCMQVGVEHYRRSMPRCMGALYWQLNDCWPVASWSSLEFTGRWKALHHAARRFFAPALITAHVPGDEKTKIGNYRESTVDTVHLHTVYDAPEPKRGAVRWEFRHLDGRCLQQGRQPVRLTPGVASRVRTLDLRSLLTQYSRDEVYLRIGLEISRQTVSEQTVFLSPPRFLDLPNGRPHVTAKRISDTLVDLTLRSPVFLHAVELEFEGFSPQTSDNYFDLYPGIAKVVRVALTRKLSPRALLSRLQTRSLIDVYD